MTHAQASSRAGAAPSSDGEAFVAAFESLKKKVMVRTWILSALIGLLVCLLPFAQPVYVFYAMTPEKKIAPLIGLSEPNMTNRAVLAWSTTSITEMMTMGFGDIAVQIPKQRPRFTEQGWEAYKNAFIKQKIGETFRQSQLVLTTVPTNTPVILNQGVNYEEQYQWVVQMPVIMTYATNNNVMQQKKSIVTLTIIRVPAETNSFGIAIQSWIIN